METDQLLCSEEEKDSWFRGAYERAPRMKKPVLIPRKNNNRQHLRVGDNLFQSIISLGLDQHCLIGLYAIILTQLSKIKLSKSVVTVAMFQVVSSHTWLVAGYLFGQCRFGLATLWMWGGH